MSKRSFYRFSKGFLFLLFLQCCLCPGSLAAQTPTPTPEETTPPKLEEKMTPEISASPVPPPPPPTPTPDLTKIAEINLIHFGDLLDVDVVGSTEYDWRGTVSPEGLLSGISFLEEPIYALCRTEDEVAAEFVKGFGKLLRDPQVIVRIIDRSKRPVSLLFGAVRTPLRFQIRRAVRLNELLILSGGLTERASGEIQIYRPPSLSCQPRIDAAAAAAESDPDKQINKDALNGERESQEKFIAAKQTDDSQFIKIKIGDLLKGTMEANPLIFSGDVVTVLEAAPIYVIGGVMNPKQINAQTEITLSRAIAAAGGFTKNADPKNITIFRRANGAMKTIDVDFEKVKSGESDDLVLGSLDVIDVAQFGRDKRKFPPILSVEGKSEKYSEAVPAVQPPLRIID